MVRRALPIAIAGLLLSAACVTGCSNQGSSNGENSRGGNPNNTPAGQLPAHNQTSTSAPSSPNN